MVYIYSYKNKDIVVLKLIKKDIPIPLQNPNIPKSK